MHEVINSPQKKNTENESPNRKKKREQLMNKYNFSPDTEHYEKTKSSPRASKNGSPGRETIYSPIKKDGKKRIIEISSLEDGDEDDEE
jgi:hypothetical protein